jgi:hypothetical protein
METLIRRVADVETQDRSALERVVGHPLKDDQQLIIQIVGNSHLPAELPPADENLLPSWCRVYEGLSDEAIEAIDGALIRNSSSRDVP